MKKIYLLLLAMVMMYVFAGCGKGDEIAAESGSERITVFAAASLSESFTELAKEFKKKEGNNVKVEFNFAGSQTLKTLLENGAKADIYAPAEISFIDELKNKGFLNDYKVLAKNKLVLANNIRSKYDVKDLKSLASRGIRIAVGDKTVPVGKYWIKALERALEDDVIDEEDMQLIEGNIKTRELNVKDIVSKVYLNEVDVGVVYATDLTEANTGKLKAVEVAVFDKIIASYPIAILNGSEDRDYVKRFYGYVLSDEGKKLLQKHKFIVD
ncbi:molybdate ABC transporter substrate-binding protein [Pseudobacteroides cellulosolvens]|uniref:Molybdenum ABC transporter, periplasmic molybdate-binding protein n=1 Tax=Pseudobacteroides cellulosolvens ATCC 35603 = DSM 2933 TaxID=398512 RepID=A0A0L6JWS6_9FIRM|nr:molybdate ABC transporter substrate-binding protein [Pseudobacteroides cellulosolvens]KNY30060.1 molybdenum ABC transporter, periplasmic molybdate-binding protein [Pseudobacteroides cellulosolvens ATCC 35603 = DSM 2933]